MTGATECIKILLASQASSPAPVCAAGGQSEEGVQGPWLSALRPSGEGAQAKQAASPHASGEGSRGRSYRQPACAGVCVSGNILGWQGTGCLMPAEAERGAPCTQLSLCDAYPGRVGSAAVPSPRRAQGPMRRAPPSLRLIATVRLPVFRQKEGNRPCGRIHAASTQQPSALINLVRNVGQDAVYIILQSPHQPPKV